MIFKKVIQILIILLIILISYLVLNIYFFDKKDISDLDLNENLVIEEDNLNFDNVMENLEYKSSDNSGNNYIIKAKKGKVNFEKENLLILEDVYGEIKLAGKSTIYIYSNFGSVSGPWRGNLQDAAWSGRKSVFAIPSSVFRSF